VQVPIGGHDGTRAEIADHPDSIDVPLFEKCLRDLKQGKATEVGCYCEVLTSS
jgi:uridine kinase